MPRKNFFEDAPVIAAVKDEEGLAAAAAADCRIVFVLFGNICNIDRIVHRLKTAGKTVIVHLDLVDGFSTDEIVVDFIRKNTEADGIISTKQKLVTRAKQIGLIAGLRTFIIDSKALEMTRKQLASVRPDFLEILPAVAYSSIAELHSIDDTPLIGGGLIKTRKDIYDALDAGAVAVSTTDKDLWE